MNKGFVYSDLFQLLSQSEKVSKLDFVEDGKTPAYSSDTSNNGCLGFVDKEPLFKISNNRPVYLIFGDHTKTMNIVHNDFCVMDNVKVLIPKLFMTDEILLYIATSWKKAIPNLGYARHWSKAKEVLIQLPVIENSNPSHEYTVDDIDWQYMRNYITELEYERITELDAYLKASNLNDYELTEEDKKVLSEEINTKEFVMHDIFEPLSVKKAVKANVRNFQDNEFCIPVVYAKFGDNGIMYWGKKGEFTTYSNVISIVYNGAISAGKCYAQEDETGILAESYLIKYKNGEVPFLSNLYMSKVIEHKIYPLYSRETLAIWNNRVENEIIELPITSDGEPNFDYMERYIRAIEKIVIADVVRYKDKVIEAMRKVVNK